MVWQKLVSHVNDTTVEVESKSGAKYPARTESDRLNDGIYSQLINEAHDHKTFWAWVEFPDNLDPDEMPVVRDYKRGMMPTEPPWEHG